MASSVTIPIVTENISLGHPCEFMGLSLAPGFSLTFNEQERWSARKEFVLHTL